MDAYLPEGVTWTRPDGGPFLWVTLPEGMDAQGLLAETIAEKVAFVPGRPFYAAGGGENTMRLNFSNASPAQIEAGIERLGRVIRRVQTMTWSIACSGCTAFHFSSDLW